jgi:hypothetical protein
MTKTVVEPRTLRLRRELSRTLVEGWRFDREALSAFDVDDAVCYNRYAFRKASTRL